MQDIHSQLSEIFLGALSQKAQGFLLVPPRGYTLEQAVTQAIQGAYGTERHPDVRVIQPEGAGNIIPVDAIRKAQSFLFASTSGSQMKTLVILQADRMNDSSANALLKPLEEPTEHTRLLLVTDNPGSLPSTIRSRCSVHPVGNDAEIAREEMAQRLGPEAASFADEARTKALGLSDGDPTLAADILRYDLSTWLPKAITWLSSASDTPPLPALGGKSGVPLASAALALQAGILQALRTLRGEISGLPAVKGWSEGDHANAAWICASALEDITRAGIDAKTRLHRILITMKARNLSDI